MKSERWRCFIAVPIAAPLRAELAAAVDHWRVHPDLTHLRWAGPESWHVTLAFLGSVEPAALASITESTREVAARHAPMRLPTGGLGGFPSAARARVAWYGIGDNAGRLAALAHGLQRTLGVAGGTPYRAHVTLARAKHDAVDLRDWIAHAVAPTGELVVDRVDLMRSHLGRGPALYEQLASVSMGAPAYV